MSAFTKSIVTVAALLASVSIAAPAQAVQPFTFNFLAPTDSGITATGSGTLTTSSAADASGRFQVTSVSGSYSDGTATRPIVLAYGLSGADFVNAYLFRDITGKFVVESIAFNSNPSDPFDNITFFQRTGTGANTRYGGLLIDSDIVGASLNFAAVPEPATWAMMLVGFAGIGLASRRKRATLALA